MAIFKPKTSSTPSGFLGPIEVGIIGFTNRSGEYDWADIFIEVELSVKNSEYSNKMSILGRLDKDSNGQILGGSVLKRMYNMFDAIQCPAGLNLDGKFEDEEGNSIEDIGEYLNKSYTTKGEQYTVYAYKKKPKPGKKVYTEIYPRLYPLGQGAVDQCLKDVAWLKSKGVIKEADESDMPQQNESTLAATALDNL
tara:strand:- start:1440 stop:2024 length:585 start_codon:yes stop_codon:yes gene_type:complete